MRVDEAKNVTIKSTELRISNRIRRIEKFF